MKRKLSILLAILLVISGLNFDLFKINADETPTLKVTFYAGGHLFVDGLKDKIEGVIRVDEPIQFPKLIDRADYKFKGWVYERKNFDGENEKYYISSDKKVTVFPQYTIFNFILPAEDGKQVRIIFPNTTKINLKAEWEHAPEPDKLTVSFDSSGGDTVPLDQNVESGNKIPEPVEPSKEGYIFSGWRIKGNPKIIESGDYEGREVFIDFDKEVTMIGGEYWNVYYTDGKPAPFSATEHDKLSLEAVYFKREALKISFNTDDGTPVPDSQLVYDGEKVKKPQDPVKDGYVFDYWTVKSISDDKDWKLNFNTPLDCFYHTGMEKVYGGLEYNSSDGGTLYYNAQVDLGLELFAIYKKADPNDKKYKVKFDTVGGSPVPAVQEVAEGGNVEKPQTNPSKDGYEFLYWAFDNGEKTPDFSLLQISEDLTLKAVYKKLEQDEVDEVTVQFDAVGGSPEPESQTVKIGEKVLKPDTDPSKQDAEFIGWYDAEGEYNFDSPVEREMILYAKYKKDGESHDKSNRKDIDIDDKDYEKAIIKFDGAFFTGYPDKTFKPEDTITRAQMATVFSRILGLEDKEVTIDNKFSDIDNHWAKKKILRVAEYGLINGYPDGTFRPNKKMKRGEIASIINKYWELQGFEPNINDANISDINKHWAKKLILALYNHRFVDLNSDGNFNPNAPLKRVDVAQILNRITDRPLKKSDVQKFKDVPKSYWGFNEVNTASSPVK